MGYLECNPRCRIYVGFGPLKSRLGDARGRFAPHQHKRPPPWKCWMATLWGVLMHLRPQKTAFSKSQKAQTVSLVGRFDSLGSSEATPCRAMHAGTKGGLMEGMVDGSRARLAVP